MSGVEYPYEFTKKPKPQNWDSMTPAEMFEYVNGKPPSFQQMMTIPELSGYQAVGVKRMDQ